MKRKSIIVPFHIGRGGRSRNPGSKTFVPYVTNLQDCFKESSQLVYDDLYGNTLPDREWMLTDLAGNIILQGRDAIESETGTLEWDTAYDTDIVRYVENCLDDEMDILYQAYLDCEYMSDELKDAICELKGMKRAHKIQVYPLDIAVFFQTGAVGILRDGTEDYCEDDWRSRFQNIGFDQVSIDAIISKMKTCGWL